MVWVGSGCEGTGAAKAVAANSERAVASAMRFMEFSVCGVCRKDGVRGCGYSIRAASSKPSRGARATLLARSHWPRLTCKLYLLVVTLKKASSPLALSQPAYATTTKARSSQAETRTELCRQRWWYP